MRCTIQGGIVGPRFRPKQIRQPNRRIRIAVNTYVLRFRVASINAAQANGVTHIFRNAVRRSLHGRLEYVARVNLFHLKRCSALVLQILLHARLRRCNPNGKITAINLRGEGPIVLLTLISIRRIRQNKRRTGYHVAILQHAVFADGRMSIGNRVRAVFLVQGIQARPDLRGKRKRQAEARTKVDDVTIFIHQINGVNRKRNFLNILLLQQLSRLLIAFAIRIRLRHLQGNALGTKLLGKGLVRRRTRRDDAGFLILEGKRILFGTCCSRVSKDVRSHCRIL